MAAGAQCSRVADLGCCTSACSVHEHLRDDLPVSCWHPAVTLWQGIAVWLAESSEDWAVCRAPCTLPLAGQLGQGGTFRHVLLAFLPSTSILSPFWAIKTENPNNRLLLACCRHFSYTCANPSRHFHDPSAFSPHVLRFRRSPASVGLLADTCTSGLSHEPWPRQAWDCRSPWTLWEEAWTCSDCWRVCSSSARVCRARLRRRLTRR